MKKVLLLVTLSLFIVVTGFSQGDFTTTTGPSFEQLKKAKEKNDEIINSEKHVNNPKSWYSRGKLFQDIYEVGIKGIGKGMDAQTIRLILGEPDNILTKGTEEEFVYKRVKFFMKNAVLDKWMKTEVIVEDPLNEAFNAYLKVIELDEKKKFNSKLKDQFEVIVGELRSNALNEYENKNKENSFKSFELIVKVYDLGDYIDAVDTVNIYLAGLVAKEIEKYDKAEKYMKRTLEMNFYNEGDVQLELGRTYIAKGDSIEALNIMKEGFKKFPGNETLLVELINLYLQTNQEPLEIVEYLNIAKKQNPENASLWLVEGTLYEKMNQPEKAMKCYKDAVEVNENYFDGYYNLGVIIFNQAVAIMDKANAEKDFKKFNQLKNEADVKFEESIPYFEKALEIQPKEKEVLEALKSLYYRLQKNDKYEEVKTKLENL